MNIEVMWDYAVRGYVLAYIDNAHVLEHEIHYLTGYVDACAQMIALVTGRQVSETLREIRERADKVGVQHGA